MPKQVIAPADVHQPIGRGYSHAIRAGNTVYVAGQVALDKDGNLVVISSLAMPELLIEAEVIAVTD